MWLIFRLKMPCFSHQGFLGGGDGGGGGHGFGLCNEGGKGKTHQIIRGGLPKNAREKI